MKKQSGAFVIEFALVLVLLLLLAFGMLEVGRMLFKWNSAVEATRVGARTAAIAAVNDDAAVLRAMNVMMVGELDTSTINVDYSVDGVTFGRGICVRGTCRFVRVQMNYVYRPMFIMFLPGIRLLPATLAMPTFTATYPVEALGGT